MKSIFESAQGCAAAPDGATPPATIAAHAAAMQSALENLSTQTVGFTHMPRHGTTQHFLCHVSRIFLRASPSCRSMIAGGKAGVNERNAFWACFCCAFRMSSSMHNKNL